MPLSISNMFLVMTFQAEFWMPLNSRVLFSHIFWDILQKIPTLNKGISSILESIHWDSNVDGSSFGLGYTLHGRCIHLTNGSTHHAPRVSDCKMRNHNFSGPFHLLLLLLLLYARKLLWLLLFFAALCCISLFL